MSQYEPLHRVDPVMRRDAREPEPDFYMPAMPPLGLIRAFERWWRAYRLRRQFRRRYLSLLAHDDHMLEDMGHHREDILWASKLPLKVDADQTLARCRALRRRGAGSVKRS